MDVDKALGSKPVADVAKSLQGITPGLTVTYKSGNLGGDATIKGSERSLTERKKANR
ncbi:MAG: hypothetical protein LIP05_06305 [Tannerellaceae bacterium]|nr:hypothetical protein [Tannerellaceae bacterium]